MLCTGVCTTCGLRTAACGQPCGKPVEENKFAKPIAAQGIGPLEISHALQSEGLNGETREGRETGAQVSRITDDRLDRVRPDEVLEAFGHRGPRATPRRNAGPVDQIAPPVEAPVRRRGQGRHRRSGHDTRFAGWRGGRPGQCLGPVRRTEAAPPVGSAVTSVTAGPAPVADNRPTSVGKPTPHLGSQATSVARPPAADRAPPRWRRTPHPAVHPAAGSASGRADLHPRAPRTHTSRGPHLFS